MIVKLIRMSRRKRRFDELRDNIYALTRYVVDADPWAMAMTYRDQVRSLTEYLVHVRALGIEPGEKAGHIGSRNLLIGELPQQQMEMLAIASKASRVEYPVIHIIVSWQSGECPSAAQLEETVDTVLATTGLLGVQTLFAEHTNTAHRHLHIAAVRIDPENGQAAGSEWLIEDLHQAIAILEERHGWAAEPNALYYARNGAVFDANRRRFKAGPGGRKTADPASEVMVRDARGRFITHRDRRGLPSDIANVRADILCASAEAESWADFHRRLDEYQIVYRKKGSGARIGIGEISAKASTVSPELALEQMKKRWGPFIPHPRDHSPVFEQYRNAHAAQLERLRADRASAQRQLDEWSGAQLDALTIRKDRRIERAIRFETEAAQRELNVAFTEAIRTCVESRYTSVARWLAAGSPDRPPNVDSPSLLFSGSSDEHFTPMFTGLRAKHDDWATRYYDQRDRLVLTDHRSVIVVHQPTNTGSIDAALKMAAERWGQIRVNGSVAFQQLCAERAAELGIAIVQDGRLPVPDYTNNSHPVDRAPQTNAEAARPQPEAERAREAAIAEVIADLKRMGHLPMRRRRRRFDEGSAPLEIVVDADRFDPKPELSVAALFDEDPRVQSFLEKHRAVTLIDIGHHLLMRDVTFDKVAILNALGRHERLAHAALLAFDDPDFQSMLKTVEQTRTKRQRLSAQPEFESARNHHQFAEADLDEEEFRILEQQQHRQSHLGSREKS